MAMRCFQGVSVGFPEGVPSQHTKDNFQNSKWVLWATGELRIDTASFAIIVMPDGRGGGGTKAKPFGVLTGASIIASGESSGLSTFVAMTNDPVHGVIRLDFCSLTDEEQFAAIAHAAEACGGGRMSMAGGAGRRSSVGGFGRRSSVGLGGGGGDGSIPDPVRARILERHPGAWPLLVGGAELYGPDPHGDQGSEVLLGRGVVALLDPQDTSRVGAYELLFYDEGLAAPLLRLTIGPRVGLEPAREPAGPRLSLDGGAFAAARRRSAAPSAMGTGHPVAFDLFVPGGGPWGLSFDHELDAAGFARDFAVRQRLVQVALKTSRGWRTVDDLQDEIREIRQQGLIATMRRLLWQAIVLSAMSLVIYTGALYSNHSEKPPMEVVGMALQDATAAALALVSWSSDFGVAICSTFGRNVPVSELQRCVSLPEAAEARSCAASLVGSSSASAFSSSPGLGAGSGFGAGLSAGAGLGASAFASGPW